MKTVELSAALGQAQVVENLKNFVGVDAQGAAALMTPERLAAVAGELLRADKKLIDNKSDLNNIEDGWYFYANGNNPANCPLYSENSLLLQFSYSGIRRVKFQLVFSENSLAIFFRVNENQGNWCSWKEVVRIPRD